MFTFNRAPRVRLAVAAALMSIGVVPILARGAAGQESLSDLKARMEAIQADLDATTEKIEALRTDQDHVLERIASTELRLDDLQRQRDKLLIQAEERASLLYREGPMGMAEAILSSESFGELYDRAELVAQVTSENNEVFTRLSYTQEELEDLEDELEDRRAELQSTTSDLEDAVSELRTKFDEISDDYKALKKKLAAAAAREEAAEEAAPAGGGGSPEVVSVNGKVCPVAGPVSFVDSWLAPRSGHLHQGVDMMADYGTPLVAIVSGTISSSYSSSGGNSLFLSGSDGNSYWYLHNQTNLVTSGHVSAGQKIGTVGDTGNATGIPHLHFEYHPGGGAAVNPYPLVASIC